MSYLPNRTQARSYTHSSRGGDIILATRSDTFGLTPTLGLRSLRRGLQNLRVEARSSH